jgi:hypothetical protein
MQTEEAKATVAVTTSSTRLYTSRIIALAASLRLGVLWLVATHFPHDWLFKRGIELGLVADSLQAGRGFSSPYGGSTGPTALIAPGYPVIVAVIFRLFGSFTLSSAIAVIAMQIVFSSLTVLVMMRLARWTFGAGTANVAGTIWAVSIPLLWMPTIFWESCLSTLLLVSFVALAAHRVQRPSLAMWVLLGATCGGTTLVNPALLPAFLAVMGWVAYQSRRIVRLRYAPLLGVLVVLLVVGPWIVRNHQKLNAFIPVRSCFGFEFWNGNQPRGGGLLQEGLHPTFNRSELELYSSSGEVSYMRQKMTLARNFIRSHPSAFLRLTLKRAFFFWTGTGQLGGGEISWVIVFHAMFTTLLGVVGLILLFRSEKALALLYGLPMLLFPLPYYITHADFRYRLVIDPLLTILTAYAIARGYARVSERPMEETSERTVSSLAGDHH